MHQHDLEARAARAEALLAAGDDIAAAARFAAVLEACDEEDASRAPRVVQCLIGLALADRRRGMQGEAVARLRHAVSHGARHLGVGHSATMEAHTQLVAQLLILRRYEDALSVARELYDDWRRRFGERSDLLAHPLLWMAQAREGLSDLKGAERDLLAAVEVAGEGAAKGFERAKALCRLGRIYYAQGRLKEARRKLRAAVSAYPEDREAQAAGAMQWLARTCRALGDYAGAERWGEECLSIRERAASGPDAQVAAAYSDLSFVYSHQGKTEVAAALVSRALEIERANPEATGTALGVALHNLGEVRLDQDRLAEAEALFGEALERFESDGASPKYRATTWHSLGWLYAHRGELARACTALEKAIAGAESDAAREDLVLSLNLYAEILRDLGRFAEAEQAEARARRV